MQRPKLLPSSSSNKAKSSRARTIGLLAVRILNYHSLRPNPYRRTWIDVNSFFTEWNTHCYAGQLGRIVVLRAREKFLMEPLA